MRGTDADALSASYAQGRRDERKEHAMTATEWAKQCEVDGAVGPAIASMLADFLATEAREAALVNLLRVAMPNRATMPIEDVPKWWVEANSALAGKWYRGDDKPACTCGLDAVLAGRSTP